MILINLQITCRKLYGLPKKKIFISWIQKMFFLFSTKSEVTIRLVDEVEIRQLNMTYCGKNFATNILSFPFESPFKNIFKRAFIGDVVICRQIVEKEAIEQKKLLEAHWAHIVVHGILHLLGYNHILDKNREEMEILESKIIKNIGFKDPHSM